MTLSYKLEEQRERIEHLRRRALDGQGRSSMPPAIAGRTTRLSWPCWFVTGKAAAALGSSAILHSTNVIKPYPQEVVVVAIPLKSARPSATVHRRARRTGTSATRPRRRSSRLSTRRLQQRPRSAVRQPHTVRTQRSASAPRDQGTWLMLVFMAALTVMVAAVAVLAVVDAWWVLVPVMCLDLAATFVVLGSVARLLHDESES